MIRRPAFRDPASPPRARSTAGACRSRIAGRWAAHHAPPPPPIPANDDGWPPAIAAAARSLGLQGLPLAQARALDAFLVDDRAAWSWWGRVADRLAAHRHGVPRP